MPGDPAPGDEPDLIRTPYQNLESAGWWESQCLDAVVLYAWGRPRFRKVAEAVHRAGIFLILNQDSAGLVSPLAGWRDWLRAQWIYGGQGRDAMAWVRAAALAARGLTAGLFLTDPLRAAHLKHGDVITCVSPVAAERYRRLCSVYGGAELAGRVEVLPHAVEPRFRFQGHAVNHRIACVGRWEDQVQKRAWLMMEVIGSLLASDKRVTVEIVGRATDEMRRWHQSLASPLKARVRLHGQTDRDGLAEILRTSRVFYCPSAYESFGIAAAEALCSGCSVVAARAVTMPSFEWFSCEDSGRLVDQDHAEGHLSALVAELEAWNGGRRDAERISDIWSGRLHADKVAERIVKMSYAALPMQNRLRMGNDAI
jgi:glycosyltransferase involved in cell wall biosynthesis